MERTSSPTLEAGQRLRQPDFHARYVAMPPGTRAELVGGVVVMPSPVGNRHGIIRVDPGADGIYRSVAFPGLWLDPAALFDDDGLVLLATLDRGLATLEHTNFVAELAAD